MSCKITTLPTFTAEAKRLAKKYKSFREDFLILLETLQANPNEGTILHAGIHKVRMQIKSKGKGKSGGARVITVVTEVSAQDHNVKLLFLYDKSDRSNVTDRELKQILKKNGL